MKKLLNLWLCKNPEFSTNCKAPAYGGDSACPPEPPLRFKIVSYYLLWVIAPGGYHSGGVEALHAVAPTER